MTSALRLPPQQLSMPSQEPPSKLYPYQEEAVSFLQARMGAILADDMGLGKTASALTAAAGKPTYVIAPASVCNTWLTEATRLRLPAPKVISYSRVPAPTIKESLRFDGKKRIEITPREMPKDAVLILDEAHAVKNWKSKRSQAVESIAQGIFNAYGQVWPLTATPMLNHPIELWALLSVIGENWNVFHSWQGFLTLMGGRKKMPFGGITWESQEANIPEVKKRLARVMLRRMKSEVAIHLPAKRYVTLQVEVPKDLHRTTFPEAAQAETAEEMMGIAGLSEFRAVLAMAKYKALESFIDSFDGVEPLAVFSAHTGPILSLEKRDGWAGLHGALPVDKRIFNVERFQGGRLNGLALTIGAGGVGITLTHASNALFIDQDWTPALNRQAEDRIHRIGQHWPCTIYVAESDHPVDMHVRRVNARKAELIDAIL